jgi:hypothetical protein
MIWLRDHFINRYFGLRILIRLWRRRGLLYIPLLSIIGAVLVWAIAVRLATASSGRAPPVSVDSIYRAALPIFALLAAGFAARYLAWVYFVHLQHSRLARGMRRWVGQLGSAQRRYLLFFSGMIGGLVGGILSAPLVGHAYIGSADIADLNRSCEFGILYCSRFYWILFCTSFAGATLGSCIGLFLHRACLRQVTLYPADHIMNFWPRAQRFLSCILGGVVAALIAGPVIGIGSAALGGPPIRVSDIFFETIYTVIIISVFIIGAFRSWNVRFLSEYIESLFLLLFFMKILDASHLVLPPSRGAETTGMLSNLVKGVNEAIQTVYEVPGWIDDANRYFFQCDNIGWDCVKRVGIGSIFYPVIVGLFLAAQVGVDAFMAQPRAAYSRRAIEQV